MKIQASFVQDGKWWVGWTDDVPGALTQGATLEEARKSDRCGAHDSGASRFI
jgi:predicted RNase H-like HicB family nuclease